MSDEFELKYHEYLIQLQPNNPKIYNAYDDTLYEIEDVIAKKHFKNYATIYIVNYPQEANINLVDDMLRSLVISEAKLQEFKNLCYSILVEPSATPIIFEDVNKFGVNEISLTKLIRESLFRLNPMDSSATLFTNEYFSNTQLYNKEIKSGKYKCVIITEPSRGRPYNREEMIQLFIGLGAVNIIYLQQEDNILPESIYNYQRYHEFLATNMNSINNCCIEPVDYSIRFGHNVLCSAIYMLMHFVKWCVYVERPYVLK
jgi:hypothetical protein